MSHRPTIFDQSILDRIDSRGTQDRIDRCDHHGRRTTIWQNATFKPRVADITSGLESEDHVIFEIGSGAYYFVLSGG